MKKPLLIVLFLTIVLTLVNGHAMAEEVASAKFTGKTLNNPHRDDTGGTDSDLSGKAVSGKAIANGDVIGMYDVWFDMQQDNDGDGFYQRFDVFFDIDSRYSNTRVYVTGQLNNGSTTPLFRTDPFTINGATGSDTYSATVLLTQGYPSSQYDLTLKIYDAQTNALMLIWGPQQDGQMTQLFLEDAERDAVSNAPIQLFEFAYTLQLDGDGDGYYTEADVSLDVDAPQQTVTLYASLYLIDSNGEWIPLKNSNTFTVTGYSAFDKITLGFGLSSGFDPQNYRLGVKLHDAYSHTLLLTATTPNSTPVRMESVDYDNDYYVVEEYYYEEDHHGGSTGILLLIGLAALLTLKYRNQKNQH